jgi:hypothetical protein
MANKRARKSTKEAHGTEESTPHMTKTKKAKSRNTRSRPSIRDSQAAALTRALTPPCPSGWRSSTRPTRTAWTPWSAVTTLP